MVKKLVVFSQADIDYVKQIAKLVSDPRAINQGILKI